MDEFIKLDNIDGKAVYVDVMMVRACEELGPHRTAVCTGAGTFVRVNGEAKEIAAAIARHRREMRHFWHDERRTALRLPPIPWDGDNTLIPLARANKQAREDYTKKKDRRTGIACPSCGKEIYDVNPECVLTSCPPQVNCACSCGWKGNRIV